MNNITGTVQQVVNTREGAQTITRRVKVIPFAGDMADGVVRVQYVDADPESAGYIGSFGFERLADIVRD